MTTRPATTLQNERL